MGLDLRFHSRAFLLSKSISISENMYSLFKNSDEIINIDENSAD